jgi:hypothetical protein
VIAGEDDFDAPDITAPATIATNSLYLCAAAIIANCTVSAMRQQGGAAKELTQCKRHVRFG